MDTPQTIGSGRNVLETRHVYSLHGEIAWGGMATIRLARQSGPHGLSRIVAVKNLLARSAPDSEFVSMFRDEIRVASRVNHPNVVPVLDVVTTDDELLLVMEYVHGESVARLLKRCRSAIPPKMACTIMAGVLRGLHAAHLARSERGEPLHIVHRDVTPHNMVVGVDGTPRLLDFGIAHAIGRMHATRIGHVKGKLAYMAPEQFLNTAVDRRVDIYSAAVTLWEMLAGRRLFDGHKDKMVQMIVHHPTQPPGLLQKGIPPQLDAIVLRGLHRDPRQRYATAREMAIALEEQTETVSATELGDWVSRVWGEARERREQQIRTIESTPLGSVDGNRPPPPETKSDEGALRRPPSSESITRALDPEERGSSDTPQPEVTTRPDLPSALFVAPRPEPVVAEAARADPGQPVSDFKNPGQPVSDFKKCAPMLLAVAASVLLAAHIWLGLGGRPEMGPAAIPVAIPAVPPSQFPSIEPLRTGQVWAPPVDPSAPGPYGGGVPETSPASVSSPKGATTAAAVVGVAARPPDERSPVLPAIRPPQLAAPSTSRPRQGENTVRRRGTWHRTAPRATAVAIVSPSNRAHSAASRPGPTPGVMSTTSASPTDRPETNCDPPFVVDSTGIKHFKLACL